VLVQTNTGDEEAGFIKILPVRGTVAGGKSMKRALIVSSRFTR
jgi:hypothetical protein